MSRRNNQPSRGSKRGKDEEENRKVIVLYHEPDSKLAKLLVSYLRGTVPNIVFLYRSARYGCNPDQYRHVIRLNGAETKRGGPDQENVWVANSPTYEEALEDNKFANYTKKKHRKKQASKLAGEIAQRYQ